MNTERTDGSLPLVCAVCGEAVGVISERALAVMLGTEEIYICQRCETRRPLEIERVLSEQPPKYYEQLIRRRIIADGLVLPDGLWAESAPACAG